MAITNKTLYVRLYRLEMANLWLFQLQSVYGKSVFSYRLSKIDGQISIKADWDKIAETNPMLERMVDLIEVWK